MTKGGSMKDIKKDTQESAKSNFIISHLSFQSKG